MQLYNVTKIGVAANGNLETFDTATNQGPNRMWQVGHAEFECILSSTAGSTTQVFLVGSQDTVSNVPGTMSHLPDGNWFDIAAFQAAPVTTNGVTRLSWQDLKYSLPPWIAIRWTVSGGTVDITVKGSGVSL